MSEELNNKLNEENNSIDSIQIKIDEKMKKLEELSNKGRNEKVNEISNIFELTRKLEKHDLISETSSELQNLKDQFNNFEEIRETILEIQKLEISKEIQDAKNKLREEIETEKFKAWFITKSDLKIGKFISDETIEIINNPKNFLDNTKWLFVWTIETLVIALILSKDLITWFAKSLSHITQITKEKWKYDWLSEI